MLVTQHWRNQANQIIRDGAALSRCPTCPCGETVCPPGPLWKVVLTATFESCASPGPGFLGCNALTVTDEELVYASGITYSTALNSVATPTYCDGTTQKTLTGTALLVVTCPTGGGANGSLSLQVRTRADFGTGAFATYELAGLTGLTDILEGVNYALTLTASATEPCVLTQQPIVRFEPN